MVKNLSNETRKQIQKFEEAHDAAGSFDAKNVKSLKQIAKALTILADKIGRKLY